MRISFKYVWAAVGTALLLSGAALTPAMAADQTLAVTGTQVDADSMKKEIDRLQNDKKAESKSVEDMRQEREQFVKEIRRVENLNSKYTQQIEDLRAQMTTQEQSFEDRLKKMETNVKESSDLKTKAVTHQVASAGLAPVEVEKQANDVLMKGGDVDPEDEKFKEELARAHYNMGNVYFERGEYQRAVVEYYQAVDLMPYDADAHYNLAFVSGEYVGDQETALKHYQWYLYLKPNADDRKLITEKIVAAKVSLRGHIDSKTDKTELTGQTNVTR